MGWELLLIVKILAWTQAGLGGIRGNVRSQSLELLRRTNQMIESVLLPEPPAGPCKAVDARCSIVFPGLALLEHVVLPGKGDQDVNVVRHEDECANAYVAFIASVSD